MIKKKYEIKKNKGGHISKYLSPYYNTLLGNIIHLYGFNYFLKRMMPKYISPPPSFPLFTWILHENLQSKGSKLNSVSFSPNVFAFLYYLSHLRKPVSIQVGSWEVGFESFLSPLVFPCPVNHEALKVSVIYEFYPLFRQIIFIRIIAELPHWSLLSHKSCLHTTSRVFWLK